LGDKLGKVAACLAQGHISKVTVTTHGADMKSAGRYITAAVSAGIIGGNDINLVNSAVVATEKGFEVFINPEFNLNSFSLFKMWSCQLGITCHVVNNFKMFEKKPLACCVGMSVVQIIIMWKLYFLYQ